MINQAPDRFPRGHGSVVITTQRGDAVNIRHIQPQDAQLLSELYHKLSPESRRLRFMTALPDMPDEVIQSEAQRLAQIDPQLESALIATLQVAGPAQAIGVARLKCNALNASSAEAAIVLRDDYQCQGLGTVLFDLLLQVAMVRGLKQLWLLCLAENTGMHRLVQKCGLPYTSHTSHGEITMTIELVGDTAVEQVSPV
jgi:RimJ/RimL family protein N-acetyltransferase